MSRISKKGSKIEEEKQDIDYPSNCTMNHEGPPNKNLGAKGEECLHLHYLRFLSISIDFSLVDRSLSQFTTRFTSHPTFWIIYTR